MKLKLKAILTACLLIASATLITGCASEKTPYEINDAENYTVSVKYDANGGFFTTNTSVIVDSYNISDLEPNGEKADIVLLSPDDTRRGNDAFTAVNNGYFLAGWYTERIQTQDSDGNAAYTYSGKWDFENDRLSVDINGTYSSGEPYLTLYAAWVPMFEIEIYSLSSGELVDTMQFNPLVEDQILVPQWNTETGTIDMNDFPKRQGYTFAAAYYDQEGQTAVDTDAVVHPGVVDYINGVAENHSMKLYVDWQEGEWFHIYSAQQFLSNASVSGNYVIYEDLDFTDKIWPSSLMYGSFSGTIEGNGHTFKNINLEQTNNSKTNAGLFGYLTETATIKDATFQNVNFTIKSGTRVAGTSYGLLAGTVSDKATVTSLKILNSNLLIDSSCYFGTDDYVIGLVCGMGSLELDYSGISCKATGDNPESLSVKVNDGAVTLDFAN